MKTTDINTSLIENYFGLIRNLSPEVKLDLIERITKTMNRNQTNEKKSLKNAFGAWNSKKSADEIINKLRSN